MKTQHLRIDALTRGLSDRDQALVRRIEGRVRRAASLLRRGEQYRQRLRVRRATAGVASQIADVLALAPGYPLPPHRPRAKAPLRNDYDGLLICRKCERVYAYRDGHQNLGKKEVCRNKRCGSEDLLVTRKPRWGPKLKGRLADWAKFGRRGGKIRFAQFKTAEERRAFAAQGGQARAAALSREQRRRIASRAGRARHRKQ